MKTDLDAGAQTFRATAHIVGKLIDGPQVFV